MIGDGEMVLGILILTCLVIGGIIGGGLVAMRETAREHRRALDRSSTSLQVNVRKLAITMGRDIKELRSRLSALENDPESEEIPPWTIAVGSITADYIRPGALKEISDMGIKASDVKPGAFRHLSDQDFIQKMERLEP